MHILTKRILLPNIAEVCAPCDNLPFRYVGEHTVVLPYNPIAVLAQMRAATHSVHTASHAERLPSKTKYQILSVEIVPYRG
jgi:glycerol dehydrogenase-like iron-containing ADH family enzyme